MRSDLVPPSEPILLPDAPALAVGLTPEFLPMIMTVTLAAGAQRMARGKVIVKRLSAPGCAVGADALRTSEVYKLFV